MEANIEHVEEDLDLYFESHKTLLDNLNKQIIRNWDKTMNLQNKDFRRLEYLLDSLKCVKRIGKLTKSKIHFGKVKRERTLFGTYLDLFNSIKLQIIMTS